MDNTSAAELLHVVKELTVRLNEQEREIAKLKTGSSATATVAQTAGDASLSRRDVLLKATAGVAAVTAFVASSPDIASADTRTTVLTGAAGTANYGAAVTANGFDPATQLPALTTPNNGLVASTSSGAPVPPLSSGLVGLGAGFAGVQGLSSTNYGVYGQSTSSVGVRGEIPTTSASNAIAIYGINNSSFAGPGPGAGGFGVYGLSGKGHGLVGATAAAGGAAVVGATNGVAGAYAGAFYGPVIIGGDFTVVGGAKSAAVPHPDGSLRRLYCVESPESWFEDFGETQLECGRADVTIDPNFAALADTANYHVFLTAYGGDHQLHVAHRTAKGFTVVADLALAAMKGKQSSELSGSFSWRIVAKRKDIEGPRLERVTVPPEPVLPSTEHPRSEVEPRR